MPNPILDTVNIDGTTYDIADSQARTALSSVPSDIVTSVNGESGTVVVSKIQTTAGSNNTEYNLIGTATSNTNNAAVDVYNPTLISFSKYDSNFARLTLGSTATPGQIRLYTSASGASGYTDLKSAATSTNTRTITFPDATGTVALTSDIPAVQSWALAANKPSYTFSELTSHPTSVSGYGITDAYTKTEVDGMVSGVLHYKGTKATVSALPSSGNTTGDVWHITADGSEYAWDGSAWQELGTATDLSGSVPTSTKVNNKALNGDITLTASDVGALPSNTTYVSSFNGDTGAITYTAPVTSVNGQTGAVTITIPDADDHKWNDVGLNKSTVSETSRQSVSVPLLTSNTSTTAYLMTATYSPQAGAIARYNANAYLISTTPSANDNSTKVATTAYVDTAISNIPTSEDPIYWVEINGTVNWAEVLEAQNNNVTIMGYKTTQYSSKLVYHLIEYTVNYPGVMVFTCFYDPNIEVYTWIHEGDNAGWSYQYFIPEHDHGFLASDGTLVAQQSQAIAANDSLLFVDASNNNSLTQATLTFGTSTTQYLANNGTWQNAPQPYNASTNPTGYLTINDLPLYDGSASNP